VSTEVIPERLRVEDEHRSRADAVRRGRDSGDSRRRRPGALGRIYIGVVSSTWPCADQLVQAAWGGRTAVGAVGFLGRRSSGRNEPGCTGPMGPEYTGEVGGGGDQRKQDGSDIYAWRGGRHMANVKRRAGTEQRAQRSYRRSEKDKKVRR